MSVGRFLQQAAAGNAGEAVYVDDVFSTYLYEGNGTSQTITNGIDLDGEGGLVWTKARESTSGGNTSHAWIDTERGTNKWLSSDSSTGSGEATNTNLITAFNSNGYTVGTGGPYWTNDNGYDYVSWTFRKQPGFFDVVTYTGDGTTNRAISHNVGAEVGMMIVKRLNSSQDWHVYHRSLDSVKPADYRLLLNTTNARLSGNNSFGTGDGTPPTTTEFTVSSNLNLNGSTYVCYLFAHDAQDFGTDSDESIIKCGSYTGNASATGPEIDLGFEPQWLMIKKSGSGTAGNWLIYDSMRGLVSGGNDYHLLANSSAAESNDDRVDLTPTGFKITSTTYEINSSGADYVYVAIRRPHKPAEEFAATDLFALEYEQGSATANNPVPSGFPVDAFIFNPATITYGTVAYSRLTGDSAYLQTASTSAELTNYSIAFDDNEGVKVGVGGATIWNGSGSNFARYMFRRAPGFFDVVAYTGTGVSGRTVTHNLNAVPELMIVKCRSQAESWVVYDKVSGGTKYMVLNSTSTPSVDSGMWNNTNPTDSVFTVGNHNTTNGSAKTYISYLFATIPGISKIGSYTGTAADQTIDCGFSSGARFVLIKRTDASGAWYLWDSVRGITSSDDPYILLSSTAAQATASTKDIDPDSSGFVLGGLHPDINGSGGSYIFLAIA